jgi:S-DNA-T family DNA segregation ATPase FtsK/SpoIIIE
MHRAVLRIVNNDPLAAPIPWPGTKATSINEPIVLGRFEDGDPVAIRLVGEHVLTAGTMGRGKSGVLNAFMAELSSRTDVVLWGIDMKRGLELSPWRPVLDRLATTADLLAERRERKWQPSPAEPALVIAVDELAELDADAMALLERLARMGRAEGIVLIAVTQRPSADVLGGLDARTQMAARIALGVVEPRDGELILGAGRLSQGWRPDRLAGPGYFLVLVPDQHEQPRPARAYWLTDEAVSATAGRPGAGRPKLYPVSVHGPASESRTVTAAEADDALLELLASAPHAGLTVGELAERIGRKRTWVYDRLSAHARTGRVARVGRGRWRTRTTGDRS